MNLAVWTKWVCVFVHSVVLSWKIISFQNFQNILETGNLTFQEVQSARNGMTSHFNQYSYKKKSKLFRFQNIIRTSSMFVHINCIHFGYILATLMQLEDMSFLKETPWYATLTQSYGLYVD